MHLSEFVRPFRVLVAFQSLCGLSEFVSPFRDFVAFQIFVIFQRFVQFSELLSPFRIQHFFSFSSFCDFCLVSAENYYKILQGKNYSVCEILSSIKFLC